MDICFIDYTQSLHIGKFSSCCLSKFLGSLKVSLQEILMCVLLLFGMHRVFLYRTFLSEEECDHLISLVNSSFLRFVEIYLIHLFFSNGCFFFCRERRVQRLSQGMLMGRRNL